MVALTFYLSPLPFDRHCCFLEFCQCRAIGLVLANSRNSYTEAIVLVLGVFLGSALWWLLLCGSVSLFRIRLNAKTLRWLNRISGLVLLTFGIIALSLRSQ
ncbi:LysE family transporter [Leptolyngbya ohadii]|uniref:LysE family transporter n=1 Tax=Leptolyngbya ohadii TaxID=1962290 RepID=UPI00117A1C40|nr:LysE family transporter [Leptolyngbya ohadii]